ncbi:hypothetical protein DdX_19269 [Ditylenchus destructor]|uniref:Uncharacterized protein n=1 Tax=Ditylenchus destructor TaxID=166010 RepID=A0AAD4MJZ4_9BILA|nr:hypothetical protein DdX_19269 [Ditylenchus destructor]
MKPILTTLLCISLLAVGILADRKDCKVPLYTTVKGTCHNDFCIETVTGGKKPRNKQIEMCRGAAPKKACSFEQRYIADTCKQVPSAPASYMDGTCLFKLSKQGLDSRTACFQDCLTVFSVFCKQ